MKYLKVNHREVVRDPEVIVLDKDGTLIDIHSYWVQIASWRAERIAKVYLGKGKEIQELDESIRYFKDLMGIDLEHLRMKPEGPIGVKPRRYTVELVKRTLADRDISVQTEEIESIFKEVDADSCQNLESTVQLLPGVKNLLDAAYESKIGLAVATGDITSRAELVLEHLGVRHYFEYVIGSDQGMASKPAPDILQYIHGKLGCSLNRMVMIGDHPVDIQMGLNAGLNFNIAVMSGLGAKEDFESLNAIIVNSLADVTLN